MDLVLIDQWLTDLPELNDHIGHMPKMLSHRLLRIHLVLIEIDVKRAQQNNHIDIKSKLQIT